MRAEPTSLNWRLVAREWSLLLWALYIVLIPLYVFKSGLPQPGDMLILILLPVALRKWNGRLAPRLREVFRPLVWFTAWVCIVNYAWAIYLKNFGLFGPDTFLLFPIYYVYNAAIFLTAIVLYRTYGEVFLRLTVTIIVGTVFLLAVWSFVVPSLAVRGALLFNNPNQLGYYSLLAGTLIALIHRLLKLKVLVSSAALVCCGYLALISASRAAVGGVAILLVLVVVANPRIMIAGCLASVLLVAVGGPVSHAIDASEERVRNRHSQQDFFEERGYDRVWAHEEYLFLGAGEGGFSRFDDNGHANMEIHSSAGTIIFSYGAVGAILFLLFLWRVVKGSRLQSALMLLPPMLYTIAHQGLRFTLLWVLLACFVIAREHTRRPREQ